MKKIKLTSDTPGYVKVWEIAQDLLEFTNILDHKYCSIDFAFWFCFRVLEDGAIRSGWKSKVTFYKKDNALSFDIIMPELEFESCKKDMTIQKKIMGKYFFIFFQESIVKYSKKIPSLKLISSDLIYDMELFLIQKKWI